MLPAVAATVVSLIAALAMLQGTTRFVPNACNSISTFLPSQVVGQELALQQLIDAVCEHVNAVSRPPSAAGGGLGPLGMLGRRPLVISVHGPPGVGKTYTHTLLARALYNKDPVAAQACPGEHCMGAKVVYGLSFLEEERVEQLNAVRNAIVAHAKAVPNPLIVIEDYDKLDCNARYMLRQLIAHPDAANASYVNKAIVLLESNLGFSELEQMLTEAGDRSKISPDDADARLRSVVFDAWRKANCESYEDTLAFNKAIDFFLPYFPLQRQQVVQLMNMSLESMGTRLALEVGLMTPAAAGAAAADPGGHGARARAALPLAWGPEVVDWLVSKVDFAGGAYPIEGAKQVTSVTLRHVSRIVRQLTAQMNAAHAKGQRPKGAPGGAAQPAYRLVIAPSGTELRAEAVRA